MTVTHPETTRYMMSVREAAGLAIVSGGLADSNSVFWLDVGPPVRIVDLVRRLADAAAREVTIDFGGLRAGERLHEQLLWSGDEVVETPCERVFRSTMHAVDPGWLDAWIATLARHVERASSTGVRAALAAMHGDPERMTGRPDAVLAG